MNSVSAHKLVAALVALIAAGFLCARGSETPPPPEKSPITDAEKQARLFAVVCVGDYVVAANSNGFYRTRTSTKSWERVSVPPGMSAQGEFAVSQANSNVVYFWPLSAFATKGRLYASSDAGEKWALVSDEYGFTSAFENGDGRLYAAIWKEVGGPKKGVRSGLIMSENGGKSWKDISQNIFGDFFRIFPDPKHPNRVCVSGNSIRGYIFESTDDNYSNWTNTVEWNWRRDSKTDEEFLQGGYSTGSTLYMLNARLSNYFNYDFGSAAQIQAFEISTDTNRLVFRQKSQIEIPVTIMFREPGPTVKLPDATHGEEMWGIQMISPSGERIRSGAKASRVGQARNEATRQQYRALPDFRIVDVSATNSYSRTIALSRLSDFSAPGVYRFRLCYSSSGWAWEANDHEGHSIKTDIWDGSFCSPIFTLTIKP